MDRETLFAKRVLIVGCGAVGAGVAKMLAQAGVGNLFLVDPETLEWDNIRRHELGGSTAGASKAEALARHLRRMIPEIEFVEGYHSSYQSFVRARPLAADGADLTVSCTGSWSADASVEARLRDGETKGVAVYGWMESNALAAHAVHIGRDGSRLGDAFDQAGTFRMSAVEGGRSAPPECGGATSPFGAVELAQAQALVARLAIDALRGKVEAPAWRTWLADRSALDEAEAGWSAHWIRERGEPSEWGGVVSGVWSFR